MLLGNVVLNVAQELARNKTNLNTLFLNGEIVNLIVIFKYFFFNESKVEQGLEVQNVNHFASVFQESLCSKSSA